VRIICFWQILAVSFAALLGLSVCHQNAAAGGSSTISCCWQTGMFASLCPLYLSELSLRGIPVAYPYS
jgi:hypothetical protein